MTDASLNYRLEGRVQEIPVEEIKLYNSFTITSKNAAGTKTSSFAESITKFPNMLTKLEADLSLNIDHVVTDNSGVYLSFPDDALPITLSGLPGFIFNDRPTQTFTATNNQLYLNFIDIATAMNVSFTNNSVTTTHNIPVKKYFTHDLVKLLENSVGVLSLDFQTEYLNDRIVFSDGTTIIIIFCQY